MDSSTPGASAARPARRRRDVRASHRVVDGLGQAIRSGDLRPGEPLPSERDLAVRYGVSRPSVREALLVMQDRRLIARRTESRGGFVVLPPSAEPSREPLGPIGRHASLGELVQFRMVVDAAANLIAAQRRSPEDLVTLERNMARMRAAMDLGYEAFSLSDLEFHEIIAEVAGNRLIQVYGDNIREAILDLIRTSVAGAPDQRAHMLQSVRHHADVFAAIAAGDGGRAAVLARETLYAYYASHVSAAERETMAALVRESGGAVPEWGQQ